jgi:hypothetical protein
VLGDSDSGRSAFPALRFMATLRAARDFGLDDRAVNAVALRFDARRPDVEGLAGALAAAIVRQQAGP